MSERAQQPISEAQETQRLWLRCTKTSELFKTERTRPRPGRDEYPDPVTFVFVDAVYCNSCDQRHLKNDLLQEWQTDDPPMNDSQ